MTYYVAKRPGVDNFIQELAKTFTLFVYTSSQKEVTDRYQLSAYNLFSTPTPWLIS